MRGKHGNHATASRQHRWKPGGSLASNGYVKIRVGKGRPRKGKSTMTDTIESLRAERDPLKQQAELDFLISLRETK